MIRARKPGPAEGQERIALPGRAMLVGLLILLAVLASLLVIIRYTLL